MNKTKFTFNSFLIVLIIFSAIAFVFTVALTDMADRTAVNGYYPIEGTDYAVFYSSIDPDGIYKGTEAEHHLVLEGTFGVDWGSFLEGDDLYLNEYKSTTLGFIRSDVVRVNVKTLKKELVYKNALLRGKCKSGEPVCVVDYSMPANFPESNSLIKFGDVSLKLSKAGKNAARVAYLDKKTGEVIYTVDNCIDKKFNDLYLNRTLQEVMG